MTTFIGFVLGKVTLMVVVGLLLTVVLRRFSPALRHLILYATLMCSVALPAAMLISPQWKPPVLPDALARLQAAKAEDAQAEASAEDYVPALSPSFIKRAKAKGRVLPGSSEALTARVIDATPPPPIVRAQRTVAAIAPSLPFPILVWALGALAVLLWLTIGRLRLAWIASRATPLADLAWMRVLKEESKLAGVTKRVRILSSAVASTPLAWGSGTPIIMLPKTAVDWPEAHRRVVLRHELAHIARRDPFAQLTAGIACAVYWFHPLVWIAQRRLRIECERACDDTVVRLGSTPTEYASHLLEVARSARPFRAAGFLSVAMARTSQLEGRLVSVLDQNRRRATLSRPARAGASFLSALLFVPLVAFHPVSKDAARPSTRSVARAPEPSVSEETEVPPPAEQVPEFDDRQFRLPDQEMPEPSDNGEYSQPDHDGPMSNEDQHRRRSLHFQIPGPNGEPLDLELQSDGRMAITGLDREEVAALTERLRELAAQELRRAERLRRRFYLEHGRGMMPLPLP